MAHLEEALEAEFYACITTPVPYSLMVIISVIDARTAETWGVV